jgi:hypothetical protein
VGLATAGGLAEIAAGVLGTAATWVASTGSRAAGREARPPRLVGACERQARGFGGGAGGGLACCASPSQKCGFVAPPPPPPPSLGGVLWGYLAPLLYINPLHTQQ